MTDEQRMIFLNSLSDEHLRMLAYDWALWARDQQWPPPRHWRVWLMVAGRGFGKTRAGAEWVRMMRSDVGSVWRIDCREVGDHLVNDFLPELSSAGVEQ